MQLLAPMENGMNGLNDGVFFSLVSLDQRSGS